MVAAIAALGLNVLSGYAGQISLGIAFFMAIGAYTAAWLGGGPPMFPGDPTGLGLSFLIWLPAAGIVAALIGALIGPTALRLKGFYLGIVTLALVFIGQYLFINLKSHHRWTTGAYLSSARLRRLLLRQPDDILGLAADHEPVYFSCSCCCCWRSRLFVGNVARSRAGRALQAVRDNEVAASIMGVNLFQAKMGAFILSSFLAGIAGALYASLSGIHHTRHVESGALDPVHRRDPHWWRRQRLGVHPGRGLRLRAADRARPPSRLLPQSASSTGPLERRPERDTLRPADYRLPAVRASGHYRPDPPTPCSNPAF